MTAEGRRPLRSVPSAFVAASLIVALPMAAGAGERIAGPVEAEVVRVIDGDTLEVRARLWPDLAIVVNARIRGIDTPEFRGACLDEKTMAAAARDRLDDATATRRVRLSNVEHDKYAGRVVADVLTDAGADLAAVMLASGLARPYDGNARAGWCELASLGE